MKIYSNMGGEILEYKQVTASQNASDMVDRDVLLSASGHSNIGGKVVQYEYNAANRFSDRTDENIFLPADGGAIEFNDFDPYEFSNAGGEKVKGFFKKIGKGVVDAFSWFKQKIKDRKEKRKNRQSEKAIKAKERKKMEAFQAGIQKGLDKKKAEQEAEKAANLEAQRIKAEEEAIITAAENKARADALSKGLPPEKAEEAANQAGIIAENEIYGGATPLAPVSFWKGLGTGGQISLIGGAALAVTLIVVLASKKSSK